MTQDQTTRPPDWPAHHTDAPPSADPRSLRRGILAGAAVLMMAMAVLAMGGLSAQTSGLVAMVAWIAAVGFGALAYRGRPPRMLTLTKLALVLGIASLAFAVLLLVIGTQVRDVLVGSVIFGSAGSGCTVEGDARTFVENEPIYQVAHTTRAVQAGEELTMTLQREGRAIAAATETSPDKFDCLGSPLAVDGPGSYVVTVMVGGEMLAEGAFEVILATE